MVVRFVGIGAAAGAGARHAVPPTNPFRSNSRDGLGAVAGVDAYILGGEVAGPVAGYGFAGVQIYDDQNVVG